MKMWGLCRKIIQGRLENLKPDAKDLLNLMLHGVDKGSGEKLGVENVWYGYYDVLHLLFPVQQSRHASQSTAGS